eukprot:tig00000480_g1314.t1
MGAAAEALEHAKESRAEDRPFAVEYRGRKVREYHWREGGRLEVIERMASHHEGEEDEGAHVLKLRDIIAYFFLPEGFPESVSPSYLDYSKWRAVQNVLSSMVNVLSTQALLQAVGLGRSVGSQAAGAAAINWVLKDGLGNVGKLLFARMGSRFDEDPKRYRLASDILYDLGAGLEIATPALPPSFFLLIASLANASKAVAITIGVASRASVNKSFALHENLGDITAKGDAQNVVSNLLGMCLGIGLVRQIPPSIKGRLAAFLALTAVYSFANYRCLRAVKFTTLNRQRGALAADAFIETGEVPRHVQINDAEKIIPFTPTAARGPPCDWGVPLSTVAAGADEMRALTALYRGDKYLLTVKRGVSGRPHLYVSLHKGARAEDLLCSLLQVAKLRRLLADEGHAAGDLKAAAGPDTHPDHLALLRESRAYAHANLPRFKEALADKHYNTTNLLLRQGHTRVVWHTGHPAPAPHPHAPAH